MTNQTIPTEDAGSDRAAAEAARDTIARALIVNLTSVPIGTSSSGFLYRLNPELGTVERATETFGGFFVERAFTPGHGRASFGMSASTASFDKLDGRAAARRHDGHDGQPFPDEAAPFETESLTLRVSSSTMTAYASVGITDRFEIAGALPFVRLSIEGQRISVYRGETFLQASASATASGVADAAVRAKYTVVNARDGGAAIAAEVRLPTGDEANLLGAGSVGFRIIGIGALERGPLMLSGNGGLVRGGVSDELVLGAAAAYAVHPSRVAHCRGPVAPHRRTAAAAPHVTAASDQARGSDDPVDGRGAGRDRLQWHCRLQVESLGHAGVRRERPVELHDRRPDRAAHAVGRPRIRLLIAPAAVQEQLQEAHEIRRSLGFVLKNDLLVSCPSC